MSADRLILSFHIPKTGGTSFAGVLQDLYPGAVAFFYKPHNKLTHADLKHRDLVRDPAVLAELEAKGVRVVHGHMQSAWYKGMVEPERWWTWVRDPVERVISSYYYHDARIRKFAARPEETRPRDKVRGRTLEEFARHRANRNQQSRVLAGAPLDRFGFVGVTERYEESLSLLGVAKEPEARNVNKSRPEVAPEVRALIQEVNADDLALYAGAVRLLDERLKA